jgi:hypothetical protein
VWDIEYTDTFGSWWHELTAEAIPVADGLYDEHLQTLRDEGAIP